MYRWGMGDLTSSIASGIAQMEGFNTPGTLAQRNNNPGNLRSGPGQTGTSGGFAVFPDLATGQAALDAQINLNISRGLTLDQFFAGGNGYPGYAPSTDSNNPAQYAAFVASQAGIPTTVPLNQLGGSTDTSGASAFDPGASYDVTDAGMQANPGGDNTLVLLGVGLGLAGLIALFA